MSMKTKKFTTKSGVELTLVPVNQTELAPFIQQYAPTIPQPPVETVQTANGPKEIANENNPEYKAAVQAFELKHGVFMGAAVIELGVDVEFSDEDQARINSRKRKLEKIFPGTPENQLDTYLYIKMICTDEEIAQITQSISAINNPTAQQVQAHLDTFRPGVQGPSGNEDKDAPKWNKLPEQQPLLDALPGGEALGDKPGPLLRTIGPRVAG